MLLSEGISHDKFTRGEVVVSFEARLCAAHGDNELLKSYPRDAPRTSITLPFPATFLHTLLLGPTTKRAASTPIPRP